MNRTGVVLATLLFFVTINSTYFFLGVSKASVLEWIVFNACAPSSIAYLIGFVLYMATGNRIALHVAITPLLFFGGLGLYLFPWSGYNLIAQLSHALMVSNVIWVLIGTFIAGDYRQATLGLVVGLFFSLPFINFQQTYAYTHSEAFKRVLGVDTGEFQRKLGMSPSKTDGLRDEQKTKEKVL